MLALWWTVFYFVVKYCIWIKVHFLCADYFKWFTSSLNQPRGELLFQRRKHCAGFIQLVEWAYGDILHTPTTLRADSLTDTHKCIFPDFREITTPPAKGLASTTSFTNQLLTNQTKSFENKTRLYHLCDNRWLLLSSPLTPAGLEQFGQYDVFWSLAHEENHRCKVSAWHLAWRTRSSHRTHHCSRW